MADVVITYETLFDILRKEKGRPELQQLPTDFYGQVVAYVRKRQAEVDAAGGPGALAAQKPLIQHRNVQKILRELYERRERKIIEMALNRARTESNIVDTTALLPEEKSFYEGCAELLGKSKRDLLSPMLRGDAPDGVTVPVLRETEEATYTLHEHTAEARPQPTLDVESIAGREQLKVRFIAPVPKFLGLKGETYGPFEPGEITELPGKIAAVLFKKKRVEQI